MTVLASPLPVGVSQRLACQVLAIARNTLRRTLKSLSVHGPNKPRTCRKHAPQPRALSATEKQVVKETLVSEQYCNQPPMQVYYDLLAQGKYLCSISTMHRILRADSLSGERRNQRAPQSYATPRLKASAPNEVWTWDITKLATVRRGEYLSLYVVMDLFSRYIVAWMISRKENSALATQLIEEASQRYLVEPNQLTIHQDRGAPMTAHCYLDLLSELAITASHSRPRVSNDNPMSESQFKTLKYQPDYPRRFDDLEHARQWCSDYVQWYNDDHHHSNLSGFTPQQVFTGSYQEIARVRQASLDYAYEANPSRFVHGRPVTQLPPELVTINPVPAAETNTDTKEKVNFATLPIAIDKQVNC